MQCPRLSIISRVFAGFTSAVLACSSQLAISVFVDAQCHPGACLYRLAAPGGGGTTDAASGDEADSEAGAGEGLGAGDLSPPGGVDVSAFDPIFDQEAAYLDPARGVRQLRGYPDASSRRIAHFPRPCLRFQCLGSLGFPGLV